MPGTSLTSSNDWFWD